MKQSFVLNADYGSKGEVWGSVTVNDNLIFDFAPTIKELMTKLRDAALQIEGVEINTFRVKDITNYAAA